MSATLFGVVQAAPGGDGLGTVLFGDAARLVYFAPARFATPWPVPTPGDTVAIANGTPFAVALWVIKRGAAAYTFGGD